MKKRYMPVKNKLKDMSTKELIFTLFKQNKNTIYKTQAEIAKAITETLSTEENKIIRTQSAVSKALRDIGSDVIRYDGENYHIIKIADGYALHSKGTVLNEVAQNFADKKVFETSAVYIINKNIVAYTVKEKRHEYVRENMLKAFDGQEFFDIISHDNKLYILLNPTSTIHKAIIDLPALVKSYETD